MAVDAPVQNADPHAPATPARKSLPCSEPECRATTPVPAETGPYLVAKSDPGGITWRIFAPPPSAAHTGRKSQPAPDLLPACVRTRTALQVKRGVADSTGRICSRTAEHRHRCASVSSTATTRHRFPDHIRDPGGFADILSPAPPSWIR